MQPVISIKNISKKYNITHKSVKYIALRDIISYAIFSPFQHAKNQAKKILGRDTKEIFWALKDINLDIQKGEIVGIIGKNGAGKSTLLKILTGITPPTEGEITIRGKVASLLEVGTGFHPELTGRENIFLNGAILGMTRGEIKRKFDQIVGFSGVEKFLDTPVKRYSSGMYVRLAFSVAAHLEPDILLVDEVLAVGDTEFQKKCLGKMDEVTKSEGRTVIFVSHNMDAVSRLCRKTLLLDQGKIVTYGETQKVIEQYLKGGYKDSQSFNYPVTDEEITLHNFKVTQDGKDVASADGGKPIDVLLDFSVNKNVKAFRAGIHLKNNLSTFMSQSYIQDWKQELEEIPLGHYQSQLTIPAKLLLAGEHQIEAKFFCAGIKSYFANKNIEKTVTITSPRDYNITRSKRGDRPFFLIPNGWNTELKQNNK